MLMAVIIRQGRARGEEPHYEKAPIEEEGDGGLAQASDQQKRPLAAES